MQLHINVIYCESILQANLSSSILKKKGPGMPPPPMVPGKHNMDIGTWDSPSKNGPALVPQPPPVITPPAPIEPSPLSQQKGNNSTAVAPGPVSMPPPSSHGIGGPLLGGRGNNDISGPPHGMHMNQRRSDLPARPSWSGPVQNRGPPHPGMGGAPIQNLRPNTGSGQGKFIISN